MFKKFLIISCFSLLAFISNASALEQMESETTIHVDQHFLGWTTSFDISMDTKKLGVVRRRFLSWTPQYDFYNDHEEIEATARMRFFKSTIIFDVTDSNQKNLGRVEERWSYFFPTFDIVSPEGHVIATAIQNFWGTTYTLVDPTDQQPLATISHSFFLWERTKESTIKRGDAISSSQKAISFSRKINPHFLILLSAFQVDGEVTSPAANLSLNPAAHSVLQEKLRSYSTALENSEPSEEDIAFVEEYTLPILMAAEAEIQPEGEKPTESTRLEKGFDLLLPLLTGETLTSRQKSALFFMMTQRLDHMERL